MAGCRTSRSDKGENAILLSNAAGLGRAWTNYPGSGTDETVARPVPPGRWQR